MFRFTRKCVCLVLSFLACLALSVEPALAGGLVPELYEKAKAARPAMTKDLEQLVNIDSGTGHGPGIAQIAEFATARLKSLGATVEAIPASPPEAGTHLVATLTGKGKGRILFFAHTDTVFPPGTVAQRPFRMDGDKAVGPGAGDDKNGVVLALATLKLLKDVNFTDFAKITLVLNCDEETGSRSSQALFTKLAKEHDYAMCLEGGRQGDGVVVARKGTARLIVEVKGRASHAGGSPKLGRNALMELAHQIVQLHALNNDALGTSVHFTVLKTPDRVNVIPDTATATADVRLERPEEADRIRQDAARIIQNKLIPDTEVTVTLNVGRPPYNKTPAIEALAAKAQAIYGELGLKLKLDQSGGASDGNLTAAAGTPTLDALAMVSGAGHTADDHTDMSTAPSRLYLLARLIMDLGAKPN